MSKKTRVLLIAVAAVLALSLPGGVLFSILTYSPTALRYGGATLGEDAYSYWFACMKYQLMIQNRNLGIEDSYAFWDKTAENGKTYEELLTAMGSLYEVGDTAVARDKNDQGTYYVMRYALPAEPYLSEDEKIAFSLSGFKEYASSYLYLNELEACLEECEWVEEISSLYTIGRTVKAVDYNILRYLILD